MPELLQVILLSGFAGAIIVLALIIMSKEKKLNVLKKELKDVKFGHKRADITTNAIEKVYESEIADLEAENHRLQSAFDKFYKMYHEYMDKCTYLEDELEQLKQERSK